MDISERLQSSDRPTVRVPPPDPPSHEELEEKLREIFEKITGLQEQAARIRERLNKKMCQEQSEALELEQGSACGACLAWKTSMWCEECGQ